MRRILLFVVMFACAAHGATLNKLGPTTQHIEGDSLSLRPKDIAYEVTAKDHSIRDLRTTGGGFAIRLVAPTSNIVIDSLVAADAVNGGNDGYGIFASTGGRPVTHDGLLLVNPQITFNPGSTGQHCIRLYGVRNWTIVGGTLANFATYSPTSPHTGASLNVKQASGLRIFGLTTQGKPAGFEHDRTNPSEKDYVIEDVLLVGCTFDMNGGWLETAKGCAPFRIGSNVRQFKAVKCTFIQRNQKVPIIEIAKGAKGIEFEECFYFGKKLMADGEFSDTKPAKLTGAHNGKAIP